jgi:TonB family protein
MALLLLLHPIAGSAQPEHRRIRAVCEWSTVWPEVTASFPSAPENAQLTAPKRKKGSITRPGSLVTRRIRGVWTVDLVIDEKGAVRDAKIVGVPEIQPPWPEYEEAVLRSLKKWKYSPLRVDGRPWPNCMTVTIRDQ